MPDNKIEQMALPATADTYLCSNCTLSSLVPVAYNAWLMLVRAH